MDRHRRIGATEYHLKFKDQSKSLFGCMMKGIPLFEGWFPLCPVAHFSSYINSKLVWLQNTESNIHLLIFF